MSEADKKVFARIARFLELTPCSKCGKLGNACQCAEVEQRIAETARRQQERINAQIPPLYRDASFDNVETEHNPLFAEYLENCRDYALNFENERRSLWLWGGYGTGKTMLACAIANAIIDRTAGKRILFATLPDLSRQICAGYDNNEHRDQAIYANIASADLLILDDVGDKPIGSNGGSNHQNTLLLDIVNLRVREGIRRQTIFTSNHKPTELAKLGFNGRTVDRLAELVTDCAEMRGESYRMWQAKRNMRIW